MNAQEWAEMVKRFQDRTGQSPTDDEVKKERILWQQEQDELKLKKENDSNAKNSDDQTQLQNSDAQSPKTIDVVPEDSKKPDPKSKISDKKS